MGVFTYFLRDLEQILFPNRDQHAIPAMDGGYTPNDRLDALSPIGAPIPGADDIAEGSDGAIYVSAGKQVLRLAGAGYETRSVFAEFDGAAGGLAFHPDGRLLVCVAGRGLAAVDAGGRQSWLNQVEDQPLQCLTSVAAAADGSIFMTDGSSRHEREDWVRDLMEKNHLGRLVACGAGLDGAKTLLRDLYYPHGVAIAADGKTLWFTESWKHRIQPRRRFRPRASRRRKRWSATCRDIRRGSDIAWAAGSGSAFLPCARIWSSSCCARTISARR